MNFESTLRAAGLLPPPAIADDGRWHRCKTEGHKSKKNGAFKLDIGGERGWSRDWSDGLGVRAWKSGEAYKPPSAADRQRQEAHRAAERQRRIDGVRGARELWAAGQQYRPHPYLGSKGLTSQGCQVLRTWHGTVWQNVDENQPKRIEDTWLLVPLYWRDRLVNVQRISSKGLKLQMPAAPQKSCSLILGPASAAVTVICEGAATGLAVYQSMRSVRVVIAFNSGNLSPVITELKPTGSVVIAADNDWKTALKPHMHGANPGIDAARNAAELIGAGVAFPEGIAGSDWADFLAERGPGSGRQLERHILAQAKYITRTAVTA